MDDPVLIRHMLQYIYGIDYMQEHEDEGQKGTKKTKKSTLWNTGSVQDDEWTNSSGHEADMSTEPVLGGNARVHAQMCAVADFYGIPGLQGITRYKFGTALKKLCDVRHLVELLELVCDPQSRSDGELRAMMVDKIIHHHKLLDNPKIEAILLGNAELSLEIAKRMRYSAC